MESNRYSRTGIRIVSDLARAGATFDSRSDIFRYLLEAIGASARPSKRRREIKTGLKSTNDGEIEVECLIPVNYLNGSDGRWPKGVKVRRKTVLTITNNFQYHYYITSWPAVTLKITQIPGHSSLPTKVRMSGPVLATASRSTGGGWWCWLGW